MALFQYVTQKGTFTADEYPPSGVYELTLLRNALRFHSDNIRSHESHPLHERAMTNLPTDLVVLRMSNTKVRTFPTVPPTLEELYAEYNYFLRVPDLAYATNLQVMNLGDGRIEVFEGALPPNLHTIDVRNNALKSGTTHLFRDRIVNCQTSGNPIRHGIKGQPGNYTFFNRGQDYGGNLAPTYEILQQNPTAPSVERNIYKNTENVHDGGVQDSTHKNIQYLLNRRKNIPYDSHYLDHMNHVLRDYARRNKERIGLKRYFECFGKNESIMRPSGDVYEVAVLRDFIKTPYAMHGTRFNDLLECVWLRILSEGTEIQDQLIRRFCEEVRDGEDRCTGGMMVRMCNIFIGFDENIEIELRPNDILQSRIPATMKRIRKEMNLSDDNDGPFSYWVKCINETENDLKDVKLEEYKWQTWLMPLFEQIAEQLYTKIVIQYGKKWYTEENISEKVRSIFTENQLPYFEWMYEYLRSLDTKETSMPAPSAPPAYVPLAQPID